MGTPRGTDVKDCVIWWGASRGDTVFINAVVGYSAFFPYENIYYPQPRQGKIIIAWENTAFGGEVPDWV